MILMALGVLSLCAVWFGLRTGSVHFSLSEIIAALIRDDASTARLLLWNLRLPRVLVGGTVGVCLALSGCILQGVMQNSLASPSTIGVTSGAGFLGYLTLAAFPAYRSLLPVGTILGAFLTTMLIYALAYQRGVRPLHMVLAGMAVSALFSAGTDLIKTLFAESLGNAAGFLVGGLNGADWDTLYRILPYAVLGSAFCMFLPSRMNILALGDDTARSLGLRTELFRFVLVVLSSLLAGAAISAAGMISFVGLMVPHIARILVGSDHAVLFPASALLGGALVVFCDTLGRLIMQPGEVPVSVLLSCLGAPFFLILLRSRAGRRD